MKKKSHFDKFVFATRKKLYHQLNTHGNKLTGVTEKLVLIFCNCSTMLAFDSAEPTATTAISSF